MVEESVLAPNRYSIVNSWIIFHHNNPKSKITSHHDFRLELIAQLVQPLLDLKASCNCPAFLQSHKGRMISGHKRLIGKHFAYKGEKRNRCCVCSKQKSAEGKKIDTKTRYFCPKCDAFLCIGDCFERYHTKSQY